jgi:signal transduction histidine kinase
VLVHVDDRDRAWVALRGGGAAVVERGRVTRVPRGDGFPHSTIFTIAHDQMGRVWMGGDGGLSLLGDDGARTISSAQGLPTGRAVVGVTSDDRGDLWVGLAFFGFIRIANDELMRALDDPGTQLRPRHVYDTVDGTAGVPDYYPNSGVRSARGTLWFLTGRGLTVLEPARLRAREDAGLAPPRIEGLITGDGRYYNASGAVLPPRVSQIRIDYGAATPVSSEGVRFRYRLEGFDRDWVDAVGRRQAFYTNLPPGTYRFRLQSNEGIGAWTDDRAAWTFTIEPMFYQTYWFYAASVLALGMAAVAIWRLRSRQLRKTIEAAYGERLRIGREIHDTLLQSLVGITLQLDAAYHDATERSARLPATLLAMRRQIETYIVETRESIWNLRSASLDRDDLVGAMRAAAEKLTRGEVDLTFDVSGQPRRGRPEVETHALRIGQEAIMNAVRHARASRVRVELGFDDRHIRVTVTDNGKGFDVSQALSGDMADHYGLLTMQERAAEAGGALRIESRPGDGTTVQVELPLERERR